MVLSLIIMFMSIERIVVVLYLKMPLFYIRAKARDGKLKKKEFAEDIIRTTANFWFHLIFCILSLSFSPLFFTLHLLMAISLFKPTINIVNALWKNSTMLFATLIFMVILIYTGSFAVTLAYPTDFDDQAVGKDLTDKVCTTFWKCFMYTLDLGKKI